MSRAAAALTSEEKPQETKTEKPAEVKTEVSGQEPKLEVLVEGRDTEVKAAEKPVDKSVELTALQKQLEELTKSEAAAQERAAKLEKDRDEALANSRRSTTDVAKARVSEARAHMDAIDNAIGAAKIEVEGAERDLEEAIRTGDSKSQADAYKKIARAENNISRLEDGKVELESRLKELSDAEKTAATEKPVEKKDPIEALNVPDRAKDWLREHKDFVTNPKQNIRLQAAHFDALDAGLKEFSTDYFIAVEERLGLRDKPKTAKKTERKPAKIETDQEEESSDEGRTVIVSAPVNRDTGSGSSETEQNGNRITLTREQAEHAKISGVSEEVYARNLIRLNGLKKQGHYGEGR